MTSSIGRLALGAAGTAIGFSIGGPFGGAIAGTLGSLAGNILFPQELPDIEGPRLTESQLMNSAYGAPIKIGYGRIVVSGSVVYYPGFEEHVHEETQGGKGGPTQTVRSYSYTGSFRVNFCEGPGDAFLKLWANGRLIYNAENTDDPIIDATGLNRAPGVQAIRFYLGTETQLPDPTEQADKGVNATPAYRGQMGTFFQNYPLDDTGGVPPQVKALIARNATETFPAKTVSTIGGTNGIYWEMQPGGRTMLVPNMVRVDLVAQLALSRDTTGRGQPFFPCVDAEGNYYRSRSGSPGRIV